MLVCKLRKVVVNKGYPSIDQMIMEVKELDRQEMPRNETKE